MAEYTPNLEFADALLQMGVPKMLTSLEQLELYASGAHYVTDRIPDAVMSTAVAKEWTKFVLRRAMQEATVVVAPVHELDVFGLEELAGKTIITSTVNERRIAAVPQEGREPRGRRGAHAQWPRARPEPPGRDDPRRARQGAGRPPRGRLPGDHHRPRARAAHDLSRRRQAREPLRVRDPSPVAGVLQEHQAGGAARRTSRRRSSWTRWRRRWPGRRRSSIRT